MLHSQLSCLRGALRVANFTTTQQLKLKQKMNANKPKLSLTKDMVPFTKFVIDSGTMFNA